MGNLSESPQLSRALQLARTVLDGILASRELTQANEETQSVTVVTPSDPSVRAMLGPALRHPGSRVLAPNKTSHRKSEDNKSCLVLMLPVHSLFIGKSKTSSLQEGGKWVEMANSCLATSLYVGRGHRDRCWEKHTQPLGREQASKAWVQSGSICSPKRAACSQTMLMARRSNCVINSARFWQ